MDEDVSEENSSELLRRAEKVAQEVVRDPSAGRLLAERVAAAARDAGDSEAVVVSLRAAAWAARELYDHRAARTLINEAVRVARAARLERRLAEALLTRSTIRMEEGRLGLARRDLEAARTRARTGAMAEIEFTSGLVEEISGDFVRASQHYDRAIAATDVERPDLRTKALVNRALVGLRCGEYDVAESYLDEALELAQSFSPAFAAIVAHNRALAAAVRDEPVVALRRFASAERLLRRARLPLIEHYLEKAVALLSVRMLLEAAEATSQAVANLQAPGARLLLGEALVLEARIAIERGQWAQALESAEAAVELFREQRRPAWRATAELLSVSAQLDPDAFVPEHPRRVARLAKTLDRVGDVPGVVAASLLEGQLWSAAGQEQRAIAAFERASAAASQGPALLRLQGRLAAALSAELSGQPARASRLSRLGLGELERYRDSFASAELRARAAGHGIGLAQLGLRNALRSGRPDRVWSWLERSRSVALWRVAPSQPEHDIAPLLAELRTIHTEMATLGPEDETTASALRKDLRGIEREIRDLTWREGGRVTGPSRTAESRLSRPSAAAIRSKLGSRALLQFGQTDGRMVVVVLSAHDQRLVELGSASDVVGAGRLVARSLRRLARPGSAAAIRTAKDGVKRGLSSLAEQLIRPLGPQLGDFGEMIVVPPGDLIGLPWASLPGLAAHPVRVAPSAEAWLVTSDRVPVSERVVAVAGPDLHGADEESEAVANIYHTAEMLDSRSSTAAAVLETVSGARLVHLACHGTLRDDSPTFSAFRLADGPLTVHDLDRLDQPVHHWVLAACDLGNPGKLAGPDLEGVLAALIAGGAGGIVAALVPVPDVETTALMKALHERLFAGDSLARGLRAATSVLDEDDPRSFVAKTAFACFGGG